MARGDHIFVNRFRGVYNHHGIDCGDGSVIHYTSGNWHERRKVKRTSWEVFAKDDDIQVREYDDFERTLKSASDKHELAKLIDHADQRVRRMLDQLRGIALEDIDFGADAVIGRAESRLGESNFDLLINNCEHFSAWCKTGLSGSKQIDSIWRASISAPRFMRRQTQSMLSTWFDR